eukprot:TRINITY_DN84510_c0_g1_i1.p2 TRINITY_DN84510_c0_g1~~TRINITY_DN84510_c0_g1_i1.p2  ORF type:complete len:167 (-),score=57.66 TRINITY_DN84510_c0_g1_i1:103-603(-)
MKLLLALASCASFLAYAHAALVAPHLVKANVTELTRAMNQVGINPGATTTASCARLKTLKEKFQANLAAEEEAYAASEKTYTTRICDGLGCETDEVKKKQYQVEWENIQKSHEASKGRLTKLLAEVEEIIESEPFASCPEFEEYLKNKRLGIHGKELMDETQAGSF